MADLHNLDDEIISSSARYKIWKKHVPFLYEVCSTYQLLSCTQTVEWIQQTTRGESTQHHFCIVGTNSLSGNKIFLLRIDLPLDNHLVDNSEWKFEGKIGEFGIKNVVVEKEIERYSEVNKARKMPGKMLLAVKCAGNPQISLLNLDSKSSFQEGVLSLEGHTAEGMGLEWSPIRNNIIVSGSSDRRICVWDVEGKQTDNKTIKPTSQYTFHSMGVQDVSWNHFNPDIFTSCSQDRLIAVWDLRQNKKKPQIQKSAHISDVYSVKFSPFSESLLLSAGEDGEIALWDIRYFSKRLHTFSGHTDAVNCSKWLPDNREQFISGSSDKTMIYWDIGKAGTDEEIQFIHAGHQSRVLDFDINKNWKGLIVSSEEYNLLQVWKAGQHAFNSAEEVLQKEESQVKEEEVNGNNESLGNEGHEKGLKMEVEEVAQYEVREEVREVKEEMQVQDEGEVKNQTSPDA